MMTASDPSIRMTVLGIDTVAIVVSDLRKAIAWYRDILGLVVAYIGPNTQESGTVGDHLHHRRHRGRLRTLATQRRAIHDDAEKDGLGRVDRSVRRSGWERVRSQAADFSGGVESLRG